MTYLLCIIHECFTMVKHEIIKILLVGSYSPVCIKSGKQFPNTITITNPATKNGPKCTLKFFFFNAPGNAITSPNKFAKKIVHKANHQSANASAKANANNQSPPPINFSCDAL